MAIRAIIFDCFGVLYRDNLSMLYDVVPRHTWPALQDIVHAADHGFLNREEYHQEVARLAGRDLADIQAIDARQHSRDETMVALVRSLRPRYKIGLLSNIDGDTIYRLFSDQERAELFDALTLSAEVGLTKPTVEIFEIAAQRLGVAPEECVMIDDLEKNVTGAELAGMKAIHFSSRTDLEQRLKELLDA